MSEDISEEAYRSAKEQVEMAHQQAVQNLKAKVEKAKAEALKKLSP